MNIQSLKPKEKLKHNTMLDVKMCLVSENIYTLK